MIFMGGLRNPFAVRNGKVILIEDLSKNERGLNCQCKCPSCNGDFIARMGEIKEHHFAHSKDACDEVLAYTSGLYRLIHQVLSSARPFYVPALVVSYSFPSSGALDESNIDSYIEFVHEEHYAVNKIMVSAGRHISFENAELCVDNKNHIQALELTFKDSKMAIKVMPPDTICKSATVSPHKDMATLAVDFTGDADVIQRSNSKAFQNYLLSDRLDKHWICNPKTKKVYPQILAAYQEHCEQEKQLEAEREITAEKRKQEDVQQYINAQKRIIQQPSSLQELHGNHRVQCKICGITGQNRRGSFEIYGTDLLCISCHKKKTGGRFAHET